MIREYLKRPIGIWAVQWDGGNLDEIWELCPEAKIVEGFLTIPTLEGDHKTLVGDYILQGVQGECYPCKEDIFKDTYIPVFD